MTMIRPQGELRQREQPYRSKEYRRHVASQPCMACGAISPSDTGDVASQCAHIGVFGRSAKNHDYYTIPLCPGCHQSFDAGQKHMARSWWNLSIDALKAKAKARWMAWESQQS